MAPEFIVAMWREAFEAALPWRLRAVVVLSFVDFLAQEEVGYRLCITPRTVYSDLQQVYVLVEGAKR
jgi:DNA-directed RNA polymerase specialized sigma24 family protein